MTAAERQDLIIATLRKERRVTISSLVGALGCSERTIRYDLDALSASGFPVITIRGRHGGGVELAEWYQPHRSALCPEQLQALREAISKTADPQARMALGSILDQFGPRQ